MPFHGHVGRLAGMPARRDGITTAYHADKARQVGNSQEASKANLLILLILIPQAAWAIQAETLLLTPVGIAAHAMRDDARKMASIISVSR